MRLLLSIACWNPKHGGPFFSVGNLARALHAAGHDVHLLAADYPHMPSQEPPEGIALYTLSGWLIPGIRQTLLPRATRQLDRVLDVVQPDVIHDNGLWLTLNHIVARGAKRHAIPLILSPRGTLDPWAFQYRNWKKRIALALYQRKDLQCVTCFHAASQLEADNIRAFGLKQSIAVIPNGVDIPAKPAHFGLRAEGRGQRADCKAQDSGSSPQVSGLCPQVSSPRIALFLGRMHPIKNLPTLLRAWARVRPSGWRLKLVGSSEVGHRQELEALARELGIANQVEFGDPVYGSEKDRLLRDAQLFFLVSKSENFGIAAAEAMAYGIPVVASKSTPWEVVERCGAGWWIEESLDSLTQAIQEATNSSFKLLRQKGDSGRQYAKSEFAWNVIAGRFHGVYQLLLGSESLHDGGLI